MVWRTKNRAGRRKREKIAALRKGPKITSVETGRYITDELKQQLRRNAWRMKHANRPVDDNIELVDLTQDQEEQLTPEETNEVDFVLEYNQNLNHVEQLHSTYTTTVTKYFTKIEQYLMTIRRSKEDQTND